MVKPSRSNNLRTTLILLVAIISRVCQHVDAYRGTVPIFPDAKEARQSGSGKQVNDPGRARPKVFSPKPIIKVDGVSKVFEKNEAFYRIHEDLRDLHDVSIELQGPGAIAVIGGPNSGKSTLLRCLAGWEHPDTGSIQVSSLRRMVYMGRGLRSKTGKCVRELIREKVESRLPGKNRHQAEVVTNHIMEKADLHSVARTPDKELSGSEVYRFALGMGLARACSSPTPPIFVLDGFFHGSVSSIRHVVELTLDGLQRELGVMVIFSATNPQIVMELARQVVELSRGRIMRVTTHEKSRYAQEVFKRMASTRSRRWELEDYALRVVRGEDPTTGE